MRALPLDETLLHTGWEVCAKPWLDAAGEPRKLGFSQLEWLPAQVPGHVHVDLVRHGVVADPLCGLAELGAQWIDETDWVYRLRFRAGPPRAVDTRRVLRFDGLDTVCTLRLNGELLGAHDNMFRAVEFDVTDCLHVGENELELEFESAARVGRERRRRFLAKEGLPDDVARFDERAFVRKAQYMFAWDWGPRLCSAGPWKPIRLLEYQARLLDVHVEQRHLPTGEVELRVAAEVQGAGLAYHRIAGRWRKDGEPCLLNKPALWWPAGMGQPSLHTIETVLVQPGAAPTASALDRRVTRVGLRRLRLLRQPDARGESFEFEVNGRLVWATGANWIPDSSFPSLVRRDQLSERLNAAVDMNMNMVRVWGGGVYESDDFYDVCDELGLLVWQDFPFACSYVPDDAPEQQVVREEATENIIRLRNHASLALWCGNNENLTMWHSKWGQPAPQPARYYGERIYDGTLPAALALHDSGRPYVASSPIGGANANDGDTGDQHYWDAWHGRGDWVHYRDSTARFASEFGFASAPNRRAWRTIVGSERESLALPPRDRRARWHDKTAKGYETYLGFVELHYPPAENLEELIYTSQLNQRDALRFAIEHYRRSDFCKGALIWQLNDCWPAQSWAVLDSDGGYKAAAFELRRLYAHALVSVDLAADLKSADIWAIWDNVDAPLEAPLTVKLHDSRGGRVLREIKQLVRLSPGGRTQVFSVDLSDLSLDTTLLVADFAGTTTARLLCEPKNARLPKARLSVAKHPEGIVLRSDAAVVDLQLWDDGEELALLDNFVSLPGPGERVLRARGPLRRLSARSLAGRHEVQV